MTYILNVFGKNTKVGTIRLLVLGGILSLLVGCETLNIAYYNHKTDKEFVASHELAVDPDPDRIDVQGQTVTRFSIKDNEEAGAIRFHRDDQIKVSIWGHEELDHVAVVQSNGKVTLPLVGEIYAEGKTPAYLRTIITEKLKCYSVDSVNSDLREGDTLRFFVWQHPDLNYVARIQPNGQVTLPLAGSIHAVGEEISAIQEQAQQKLRHHIKNPSVWIIPESQERRILVEPKVSVLPWKLKPRTYSVLGEVVVPGIQSLNRTTSVIDALSVAQPKETASWNDIVVIRNYNSKEPSYRRLRLGDFMIGKAPEQNIYIQANDIVMVPKTKLAEIGMYIDHFFSKTRPIFDWWIAGYTGIHLHSDHSDIKKHRELSIEGLQKQILEAEQSSP